MYTHRELSRLAERKVLLQLDIAIRRSECAHAAARVSRPLEWLDRAVAFWRRISPLARMAIVPLAVLAGRRLLPRRGILGSVLRWGPLVAGAIRGVSAATAGRRGAAAKG